MPNPLGHILPAFELLGNSVRILPATGTAIEDLQHPDPDEIDDTLINRDVGEVTAFAEIPEPSARYIYRPTPPLHRKDRHLFRFFIDGSLRTYYLGTGIEAGRTFPIELAQIGSSLIHRRGDGSLRVSASLHKLLLLLPGPGSGQGLSDNVWSQLSRVGAVDEVFELIDTTDKKHSSPAVPGLDDLRNRAGGVARHLMHKLEIQLVAETEALRNEDSWLVLDGSVRLGEFVREPYQIGVAKSFSKSPRFRFGRQTEPRDVTSILAGLPYAHRTVAFSGYQDQVAFWYVRLWEQKELDYPLMGVVKVELPCPNGEPVHAELADLLSRALVAERSVTPYGLDRRWHCHLYPIFVAEQAIKARFFSQEVLVGCIRWPGPNVG